MTYEILMPFYGDADYFKIAVKSVLSQDDKDWHLTVIDDHNPDIEPGLWIKTLSDDRITYIRNKQNLGVSKTFNLCLDFASGPYFTIMGCDDVLLPNYVSSLKSLWVHNSGAALIQPGCLVIGANGQVTKPIGDRIKKLLRIAVVRRNHLDAEEKVAASLMSGNWLYFPSISWNNEKLAKNRFDETLSITQDLEFVSKLLVAGNKIAVGDEYVFQYRRHSRSASSSESSINKFQEEAELFRRLGKLFKSRGWSSAESAAKIHLMSRLNAALEFSLALSKFKTDVLAKFWKHFWSFR